MLFKWLRIARPISPTRNYLIVWFPVCKHCTRYLKKIIICNISHFISFCTTCSPCNSFGRGLDRCRTTLSSSMTLDGNLLLVSKVALPFLSSVFLNVFSPLWPFGCPWRTSASVSSRQLKLRCFLVRLRSLSSLCSRHWATREALPFKVLSPGS